MSAAAGPADPGPAEVLVVGSGLIGTSVGLALQGRGVRLTDPDAAALAVAVDRGAGLAWDGRERARLGVLAVPPQAVAPVLAGMPQAAEVWTHVSSVQNPVQADIDALGLAANVCGSHPLAGRERSGPAAASGALFTGRPWALCPSPETSDAAQAAVTDLIERCGGVPVVLAAAEHDQAMAVVSQLPQVSASALAAVLLASGHDLAMSGPGLQDTTRIAASDPGLWGQILRQNAAAVAPLVRRLGQELTLAADELDGGGDLTGLLTRGNAGRALVPVKRSATDADFAAVRVRVADRRGQLAAVLQQATAAGIDIEDVRVEHLPGGAGGVIEVVVALAGAAPARQALARAGWDVVE